MTDLLEEPFADALGKNECRNERRVKNCLKLDQGAVFFAPRKGFFAPEVFFQTGWFFLRPRFFSCPPCRGGLNCARQRVFFVLGEAFSVTTWGFIAPAGFLCARKGFFCSWRFGPGKPEQHDKRKRVRNCEV